MTVSSITPAMDKERLWTRETWLSALRILAITAQLGLALLVIRAFALEGPTFNRIFTLAAIGFVVNAILPKTFRQPWFILLSLVGIGSILGVRNGLWLVAIGVGLIGICHLPISWWARAGLVLGAGLGLAYVRNGGLKPPFSFAIWPVLGSMFMFRLALYLHHLKHNPEKVSVGRALAYFFMLPNVAFPLFPVMDYKTFDSTWYDQDAFATYQTGLRYIARGLFHLVVYRYVYYYVVKDPAELINLADLLTYVVSTYLVYIRVSGQFHIIVGILHLFGYRMPRTNNNYYLANSFTDVWRRNNIYWKDFMMKLVYYPSFFRLRQWGQKFGLIIATLLVFLVTWVLHSYQWFWIRGDFPITGTDMLFWGSVGVFMLLQMLRDTANPAAARAQSKRAWSLRRALTTVGFFLFFSSLWALWDSESIGDFFSLWELVGRYDAHSLIVIAVLLVGALAIAGWPWTLPGLNADSPKSFWRREDFQTVMICSGLLALTQPTVTNFFGLRFTRVAQSLRETRLNDRDAMSQHRGYYEQINTHGGLGGGVADVMNPKAPVGNPFFASGVVRRRDDFLYVELVPSIRSTYLGHPFSTNQWGMRDQHYERIKPQGTYRIAILGPSDVMGSGVGDGEQFEAFLEQRLNQDVEGAKYQRYEVLDFAVGGMSVLQQVPMLEDRALGFGPDLVILFYHARDQQLILEHLWDLSRAGIEIPYPELREIAQRAAIDSAFSLPTAKRRLLPYFEEILGWTYRRLADECRRAGIPFAVVMLQLPGTNGRLEPAELAEPERAGFEMINLMDVWAGRNEDSLRVNANDKHPNVQGHQVIAERLYRELRQRNDLFHLGLARADSTSPDQPEAP